MLHHPPPRTTGVVAGRFASTVYCLMLASFVATTLGAQSSSTPRQYSVTFQTAGQSMWSAGTAPLNGVNKTFSFGDVSWDKSFSETSGLAEVAGYYFGADFRAAAKGALGVFAEFSNIGSGAVAVNYPVSVTLGLPDPNSFKEGQTISIPSSVVLLPGASITTLPPQGSVNIYAKALLEASARGRLCFFDCTNIDLFPPSSVGSAHIPLFSMSIDPTGTDEGSILGRSVRLPYTLDFQEEQATNLSGSFGLPKLVPVTTTTSNGMTISATGTNTFVDLGLDIDGFLKGPIPLGFQSPNINGFQIGYDIVDFSGHLKMFQSQTFSFTPTVLVKFVLPQSMTYREVDSDGATITEGNGTEITFRAGNTLNLTYPAGLRDALMIEPFFGIKNDFTASTTTKSTEDLVLTVGRFNMTAPSIEVIPEIYFGDPCSWANDADFLDVFSDEDPCPIYTPALNSPSVSVNLGPLYQNTVVSASQNLTAYPEGGTWELQGFTTLAGGNFTLDPENPIIGVSTSVASGLSSGTGPAGTLTQNIVLKNLGDVALSAAQVTNALSVSVTTPGAFNVRSVTTPLSANPAFNGVSARNVLAGTDALAVGSTALVDISIGVLPGNQLSSVLNASGTSALGTTVRASTGGSFAIYAFDIIPSSLNDESEGVLPVVVLGTPGMDVNNIDVSTVRLVGVAPVRSDLVTRGGVTDLNLKFDRVAVRAAMVAALSSLGATPLTTIDAKAVADALMGQGTLTAEQLRLADRNGNGVLDIGDLRALTGEKTLAAGAKAGDIKFLVLTGTLKDGTPFMGEDSIISKGGTP